MKQGLIDHEKEQPKRAFTRSSNAATSSNAAARTSDVGMVITTSTTATPFSSTSSAVPEKAKYLSRGQRAFTPLYMPLSKALGVLIRKNHLKPLEPRPLPDKLPTSHNPAKYCTFHQ